MRGKDVLDEINHYYETGELISDEAAQVLARGWQSPGTVWGEEFLWLAQYGTAQEGLVQAIEWELTHGGHKGTPRKGLEALKAWAESMLPPITSYWSSFGHCFQSTDEPLEDECTSCGGRFRRVRGQEDRSNANYVGAVYWPQKHGQSGEGDVPGFTDPVNCPSDPNRVHGCDRVCFSSECAELELDEMCEHANHDCNCVLCE